MPTLRKSARQTLVLLGIIIVAAVALYFVLKSQGYFSGVITESGSNMSDYSVVQVAGGGVYFGKIISLNSSELVLDSVFSYGAVASNGAAATSATDAHPTIFDASKVGVAPGGKYHINTSQVLVHYALTKDSQVVKTIASYIANPAAASATATPVASPTATAVTK
jgi:hypothetical protein